LQSFCATGVSSGLATRVTMTRVSRWICKCVLHGICLLVISLLYSSTLLLLGCILNYMPCASHSKQVRSVPTRTYTG
jgi:hypothetical protein